MSVFNEPIAMTLLLPSCVAQGALAAQMRSNTPKFDGRSGSATAPRPARVTDTVAASSAAIAGRRNTEPVRGEPVHSPRAKRRKRQQVQSFKPDVWDGFAKFGTRLDERVRPHCHTTASCLAAMTITIILLLSLCTLERLQPLSMIAS